MPEAAPLRVAVTLTVLAVPTFLSANAAEEAAGLTASAPMTPTRVPVLVSEAVRVLS